MWQPRLALNSQPSTYLSLLCAGMADVHHLARLYLIYNSTLWPASLCPSDQCIQMRSAGQEAGCAASLDPTQMKRTRVEAGPIALPRWPPGGWRPPSSPGMLLCGPKPQPAVLLEETRWGREWKTQGHPVPESCGGPGAGGGQKPVHWLSVRGQPRLAQDPADTWLPFSINLRMEPFRYCWGHTPSCSAWAKDLDPLAARCCPHPPGRWWLGLAAALFWSWEKSPAADQPEPGHTSLFPGGGSHPAQVRPMQSVLPDSCGCAQQATKQWNKTKWVSRKFD